MTPEERAEKLWADLQGVYVHEVPAHIAAAIREAIAAEREACAVIAAEAIPTGQWHGTEIALRIRARGDKR